MGPDCVTCSALRVTGQGLRAWNLMFRFSFFKSEIQNLKSKMHSLSGVQEFKEAYFEEVAKIPKTRGCDG